MTLSQAENLSSLESYLKTVLNVTDVSINGTKKLSGGAIQENWALVVNVDGKNSEFVLRTDSPSTVAVSHTRPQEYQLIDAAFTAGVTVPKPIALCEDVDVIGRPFYLMERVGGSAIGPHIVRQRFYKGDMEKLARRLGREMAGIHKITPNTHQFDFLEAPARNPGLHEISRFRKYLDELGLARPVLELGLRYLEQLAEPWENPVLAHHDFRTGNYMVDETGLTAILDWEFSGWSDPHEDMGWFQAMCWRFGARDKPAGGVGSSASFYAGYNEISELKIDLSRVRFWEIFAHIRWGVIALQQADRHINGGEGNLNLALTGRMLPEMEYEIITMIAHQPLTAGSLDKTAYNYDEPKASNLLDTTSALLKEKILPDLEGDARFTMLMALNAIGIASREASLPTEFESAEKLCADIRSGLFDDEIEHRDLCQILFLDLIQRLKISNPSYLKAAQK